MMIPAIETDVILMEKESGEKFSITAILNAIIKFINALIKFEF